MIKNIGKSITKILSNKYSQKIIDNAKQPTTYALKIFQKGHLKKQQKQLVILLVIKSLIRLQKSQDFHHKTIQEQLKLKQKIQDLIEKYLKKHMYL